MENEAKPAASVAPRADGGRKTARPAAPAEGGDRIRPIVAEIRQRVAELAARELALRQREQELEQQYRLLRIDARETAQREWAEAQERLQQRSAELDAQAAELSGRGSRLEEHEQWLAQRQAEQEQTRQKINEQFARLRQRYEADREQREEDRRLLRQRVGIVRQREKELERRIGLARDDVLQQRQELDKRQSTLRRQAADLERHERDLRARQAAFEDELAQLRARVAEAEARLAEGVAARETLDAERQSLQAERAVLEQRVHRLEDYDQQLRARAAALDADAARLAQLEGALAERRQAAEARLSQAEEVAREAERRRDEALALREQVEARDAENRQAQLALEVEQEELEKEQAALVAAQERFDQKRQQQEAQSEQIRAVFETRAAELRRAERTLFAGARRWWLRGGVLAVAAGVLAGLAWWNWERPLYRVSTELSLSGPLPVPEDVLPEHERRLHMPEVIAEALGDVVLSRAWATARAAGRVHCLPVADRPALQLAVDGPDDTAARRLVERVGAGYRRIAATTPQSPQAAEARRRLLEKRELTTRALQERRAEQDAAQSLLAPLATRAHRDRLRTSAAESRADYERLGRALVEERGRLADVLSGGSPRGTVSPADHEQTLAADEIYAEDQKEYRVTAVQYRSELAIAMLLLVDPLAELRRGLSAFGAAIAEQRELKPPAAVAALLEESGGLVSAFGERVRLFAEQWNTALETVQAAEPERQVFELVKQQHAAGDDAQKLGTDALALVEGIRARLDKLSEDSDGGTRAVVVAATLRGELGKLAEVAAAVSKAAEQTDLTKNFRLEALDRQLRGLRTRLDQRQTAVRQRLQLDADERARAEHVQRIAKLQQTAQELEKRREERIGEWSAGLDEVRRLDEEVARRRELEADIGRRAADIKAVEQQLAELDGQLAAVEQAGSATSVFEIGTAKVQMIAGAQRLRHALLAGLVALTATCAVGLLMVVKNPLRRRAAWEQALAELPLAGSGARADESTPRP